MSSYAENSRRCRLEAHSLFVNREHDAAFLADDAVARARRMNHQTARFEMAVLVGLRAGQNEDVLVAAMRVHIDAAAGLEANERRGRTFVIGAIKPMNLDIFAKRLPRKLVGPLGDLGKIF